ncbi:MAG: FHA domain-containing protein [Myxococcaceae bacterium]|nr:FHA domain-containing protein [Myxococcaceae bacterium]
MLKLIIEDDEGRKTVVPFVRDEITIGRQEGNTIRLTERNVSRKHARLLKQNGHVFVEDLGSYNGIKINGDRVRGQASLNEGDLVQIGDYDLAVQREIEVVTPVPTRPNTGLLDLEATAPNLTPRLPETAATVPALPVVADTPKTLPGTADEPDEADPDDVESETTGELDSFRSGTTQPLQIVPIVDRDRQSTDRATALDIDPSQAPRLVVLNTDFAGREFACIRSQLTIGRTEDNDVAIDHRSLSQNHCKLVRDEQGDWRVIDLASTNGLLVNGETYQQSVLKAGDVLELGHVKLKFVRAGDRVSLPSETDEAESQGTRAPMWVGLAALVLAAVAIGYWVLNQPKPTFELTPPGAGIAQAAADSNEAKLASAREAIERLDWVGARNLLKTCTVGESPCPEATTLLAEMDVEEALKSALDSAEQLLNDGKLDDAKVVLTSASHTKLLEKRFASLNQKLVTEMQQKVAKASADKAPAVAAAKPTADVAAEVQRLLAAGKQALKDKDLAKARSTLETCIKVDPGAADCHMTLGATYAKLDKADLGLKHYKKFLELAPHHPSASKVQQFVDDYMKSQGSR